MVRIGARERSIAPKFEMSYLTNIRHWRIIIRDRLIKVPIMVIIETSVFTRQVQALLSDEEYRALQTALANRPNAGSVIVGSGGLRKLRWAIKGKGKRGGSRVIYYWAVSQEQVLMLLIYGKSEQEDLTRDQLKTLKRVVEEEYP
jgi:mRNA-degrading endonuclease RelE of RelBE toxin-antitoxin system